MLSMKISLYQVDAFTSAVFGGNPAAVCPLDQWLPDAVMQAVAAENNLSETAFVLPERDFFRLRWFTPAIEVDLCGHATLASAFVLFETGVAHGDTVRFETRSGTLTVTRSGELLSMNFPSRPPRPIEMPRSLVAAQEEESPKHLAIETTAAPHWNQVTVTREGRGCRVEEKKEL